MIYRRETVDRLIPLPSSPRRRDKTRFGDAQHRRESASHPPHSVSRGEYNVGRDQERILLLRVRGRDARRAQVQFGGRDRDGYDRRQSALVGGGSRGVEPALRGAA